MTATDRDRLAEQAARDGERTAAERNRLGQYATPPDLAADIVAGVCQYLPGTGSIRFVEPCIGTGAMFEELRRSQWATRVESAFGVEVDSRFADSARRLWGKTNLTVLEGDFTAIPRARPGNLLVTNPPYVRHHHMAGAEKIRLQAACERVVGIRPSGLSGLHLYFILLADRWLEADGLAAWLIPSEILDVGYGSALRQYLRDRVELLAIHKYPTDDVRFQDALVSSCVIVYRKRPPADRPVTFSSGPVMAAPAFSRVANRSALGAKKWGTLFAAPNTQSPSRTTLADWFDIRRGLATGDNSFFILARTDAITRGLPTCYLKPILPGPRAIKGDRIEQERDGLPRLSQQLALLDCDLPFATVQARHPELAAYLADGVRRQVDQGYLASRRTPWYSQERRPPAPIICPYMGRGSDGKAPFRFIRNLSNATAHNVYLLLYPKGRLLTACRADPTLIDRVFDQLKAVEAAHLIQGGRTYGGGLQKVEPSELGSLPADTLLELLPDQPTLFDDV